MSDIIEVIKDVTTVTIASDGPQGPAGPTGPTGPEGAAGAPGSSGVISVVAPITNTGTSTSAIIGINSGVANGVATLDSNGKVPQSQIPAVAITNTYVVASQAAMLALTAEEGDVAVRTDQNKTYILTATPSSTLANWQELLTPTDAVQSVDGRSGTVTLDDLYAQKFHSATHASGGTDAVTLAQSQITNLTTDLAAKAALATANTFTTPQTIAPSSTSAISLVLSSTSGSGNIQEWRANGGTAFMDLAGRLAVRTIGTNYINTAASGNTTMIFANPNGAGTSGIVVKGAASQTANLQEWQNSGGTVLTGISSGGGIFTNANNTFNSASGFGGLAAFTNSSIVGISTNTASYIGLLVRGVASQTGDLLQLQDSTQAIMVSFTPNGSAGFLRNLTVGATTIDTSARTVLTGGATTAVKLNVKGVASQTANLQEWQDSGGGILGYVASGGVLRAEQLQTNGANVWLRTTNGGGVATFLRTTSAPSNVAANYANLYFRDGTVPGTLKLVVRAGAAGAETTIYDNIPQ